MGVLSPLQRSIQDRCLVYYRADPAVVAPFLPEGAEPATYRGYCLIGLCWTRSALGIPGRILPRRLVPLSDELAYCFPVAEANRSGIEHGVWVRRRETSSRFSAHWASRVLRGEYQLAQFEVAEEEGSLRLTVTYAGRRELVLRAEPAAEIVGSVFLSTRQVETYLRSSSTARPRAPLSPESPELSVAGGGWTIHPLSVLELRCPFFEDEARFPPGSLQLDSAFRLTRVRAERLSERDRATRELALRSPTPYLPA